MIKILLLVSFSFSSFLYATNEENATTPQSIKAEVEIVNSTEQLSDLISKKDTLDNKIKNNNILSKIYSNYHIFKELVNQKNLIENQIIKLDDNYKITDTEAKVLKELKNKRDILKDKLQLLKEYEKDPFKKFLKPPELTDIPTVDSPLSIISAFSYIKKLKSDQIEYEEKRESVQELLKSLKLRELLLKKILIIDVNNTKYKKQLSNTKEQIDTFVPVVEIFETTQDVYKKKVDEIILKIRADGKKEIEKATSIGMIILTFIVLTLLIKFLVRRYMADNDRYYTINKALNVTFGTLLMFTLLFAYIENVDYLVTILGFASAGIAIAMKDWFMSILGWFVIIIGGSIHVGDRVKFVREGMEYIGDIVDISLLRMTIQEDITLTSYMRNRRAGRIIFVPNNFVFTDMIANYTHAGLKTVWDGIDFMVTFDSNVSKAASIAKEVTKKYSKGYTDITRKQLNKLRSQYSMKNTNVEPRIFTFIEPYGIKVSAWYHTNAYATLTLRSTISMEIIERLQKEKDIFLAFPTQSIYVNKDIPKAEDEPKPEFDINSVLPERGLY